MKRALKITLRVIIFLTGFIISLYYYLDWSSIGKFALSQAYSRLSRTGMVMSYSDVTAADGGFTVNDLKLDGVADITFEAVTIKPGILSSILSLGAVCDIDFRKCEVTLGQTMNFGDGHLLLSAWPREILLENLSTNGEFSLNGYISLNPSDVKILRADARINIPETFMSNMGMLQNFLPLVREGSQWYLRRR